MKESPHELEYKKLLPDDLQNVAQVSFSYQMLLNIANEHLKTIYGDRATWDKCLSEYFHSAAYQEICHNGKRIDNVTLLSRDHLEKMIHDEEQYSLRVDELMKYFHGQMGASLNPENREYTYTLSSMLGLLPEENEHALFNWLIRRKDISSDEQEKIRERIVENIGVLGLATNMLTMVFTPGFVLKYPNVDCVMTQQRGEYYYRGENAFYKTSKASIYRGDSKLPLDIKVTVDHLRLCECWNLLDQFDAVRKWSYSAINYMALAQHYGLRTPMIDITSDLKTALFFACCKFGEDRRWHPLVKTEIEHADSRKEVANLGGDSRYGIIYRTPVEITDMKWALADEKSSSQIITPVGYQPFMRCSSQYSYMMLVDSKKYDLLRDPLFHKYKILLDEDLCKWIYDEMNGGNAIYPNDDIPDISQMIEKINSQCIFSESSFRNTVGKLPSVQIEMMRQRLRDHGFTIQGKVILIPPERLSQVNSQYSVRDAVRKTEITPQASPMITLPSDTIVDE